jgi:hypothetical protein
MRNTYKENSFLHSSMLARNGAVSRTVVRQQEIFSKNNSCRWHSGIIETIKKFGLFADRLALKIE